MTHLGRDISALVDGQLPPEEVERVAAHLLACDRCAARVSAERASRRTLAAAPEVTPSADLTERLLQVAHHPQPPYGAGGRWMERRVRRRLISRSVLALGGAAAVVGGLVVLGAVTEDPRDPARMLDRADLAPTVAAQTVLRTPVPPQTSAPGEVLDWMTQHGWCTPHRVPDVLHVTDVDLLTEGGSPVLEIELVGGGHHVRLIEQPGRLAPAALEGLEVVDLAGHPAHRVPGGTGTRLVVQCEATAVMVEANSDVALDVAAALPAAPYDTGVLGRMDRGWGTVVDWTASLTGGER